MVKIYERENISCAEQGKVALGFEIVTLCAFLILEISRTMQQFIGLCCCKVGYQNISICPACNFLIPETQVSSVSVNEHLYV